jgi:hypothetical protein
MTPDGKLPECRSCKTPMVAGFVPDSYSLSRQSWIAGEPDTGFALTIKIRKRAHLAITTYRCPGCGLLESYAPSIDTSGSK